jgi:hypothetical protein
MPGSLEQEARMEAAISVEHRRTSTIRRISEGRSRWRVPVETWPECDEYRGRLLFRDDSPAVPPQERESSVTLHGRSHEDVLSIAHDLPDDRLRRVLNSLA